MADRLTSRLVLSAAARAGAPTNLWFTERQLYYEICRLMVPGHLIPRWIGFTVPPVLPFSLVRTWIRRCPGVDGLLGDPEPVSSDTGAATAEPDLFDYALPRLLICQSPAVADMLRANGLPMESACPVICVDDLPLHSGLARMLHTTSLTDDGARIYVLHDDSPSGLTLPASIAAMIEVPDSATVVPIGLRRSQTAPLHLARTGLGRRSAVDVESVPPAMLLRSVHRLVRDVTRRREPAVDLRAARAAGFLTWPDH
ncbi:hypothetical protein [Gordonia humi]|uniref:Uncharacterized protein n=1 Tax=Gordonia humi TaxID=686429 RepID=A0A840ETX1_9ACTN|nr:hypothetical protein [Gordonia humi]MBB4136375.1 hypothetical protein [Gordonia humi]